MNLRTRLTTYSTFVFGIVFLIASLIIFFAYYTKAKEAVSTSLKNTTLLSAVYYLEQDELSTLEHAVIKEEFKTTIQPVNVAIFNMDNQVVYGDLQESSVLAPPVLDQARAELAHFFRDTDFFYYGIYYPDNQGDFVVYTRITTQEFFDQMRSLLLILGVVFLLGLLSIYLLSRYISNIAYKPLKDIVRQLDQVNDTTLEHGIEVPKTNDELEELISTYNALLIRLSESFLIQKNFVNYVSHEFKTPLAAISGNLEVFAQRERTPEEYHSVVQKVLSDVYQIEDLLSNLLLLSRLKHSDKLEQTFRIDEVIWDISEGLQDKVKQAHTSLNIDIHIDDFSALEYRGNQTLIHLALYNIVENAIKYSQARPVSLLLTVVKGRLQITVRDQGKGISPHDLKFIKQTFYRGKNVGDIKGSGIGLSLATVIFEQHDIAFEITSSPEQGTTVFLTF